MDEGKKNVYELIGNYWNSLKSWEKKHRDRFSHTKSRTQPSSKQMNQKKEIVSLNKWYRNVQEQKKKHKSNPILSF